MMAKLVECTVHRKSPGFDTDVGDFGDGVVQVFFFFTENVMGKFLYMYLDIICKWNMIWDLSIVFVNPRYKILQYSTKIHGN